MKKNRGFLRRIVSLTMTLAFGLSMFTIPAEAVDSDGDSQATVTAGEFSVTSDNSVGDLLANTLTESQEDQTEACLVTELEVSGSAATVSFSTLYDSDIVVGIYTEDGSQLLASGTASVTREEETATVALTGDMPEYFIATAYLLDAESHHPVSKEYTTQLYTREMQELLRKTTADFDPDRVLNLDGDTTTNFAVFSEDTVMLEETADQNVLTDNGNGTYTITNADSTITSLQPGDVFTYSLSDGMLVVVVESISVNGSTVTITEKADADLADAFDYVKIEAESNSDNITVDNSDLSEGITYVDEQVSPYRISMAAIDIEQSNSVKCNYKLDKKIGSEAANIYIKGSIGVSITEKLNVYVSTNYKYVNLKIDFSVPFNISITGKLEGTLFKLSVIGFSPVPGVYVEFTPSIVIQASVSVEVGTTFVTTVGFSYDSDNGFQNQSSAPKFSDTAFKINGMFYIGLSLQPKVKILTDDFSVSATAETGAEIKGETKYSFPTDSQRHDCKSCIDGEIIWKTEISVTAKFLRWEAKADLANISIKILDFYYSFDYNEAALTTCPHISYKINVIAEDAAGNRLPNVSIAGTGLSSNPVTDSNGKAVVYLPNGEYNLSVSTGGTSGSNNFTVHNGGKTITITLGKTASAVIKHVTSAGISGDTGIQEEQEVIQKCGDNVYWTLKDGKLIISGTGPMYDYSSSTLAPWYDKRDSISSVYIDIGVTSIGTYAFYDCNKLTSIIIPNNVLSIAADAFIKSSLNEIYYEGNNHYYKIYNDDGDWKNANLACEKIDGHLVTITSPIEQQLIASLVSVGTKNAYWMGGYTNDGENWNWVTNENMVYNNWAKGQPDGYNIGENRMIILRLVNPNNRYQTCGTWNDLREDGYFVNQPFFVPDNIGFICEWESKSDYSNGLTTLSKSSDEVLYQDESLLSTQIIAMEKIQARSLQNDMYTVEEVDICPTTGSGQQITSSFEGLVAEEEYVLIVAGDIAAEELFAADNLLYIAQATADSSGKLNFTYFLPESIDVSSIYARAFGKSNKDLADATVLVDSAVYNGLAQTPAPIVVYNGIVLEEGTDYTVAYANNDRVGTATATVIGKINYTGTKTVSFTITNGLSVIGDLNNDALIDARDMILLTRYVADWGISIREELADVNGDGKIDAKDVIHMIRYLSGWGEEYALTQ